MLAYCAPGNADIEAIRPYVEHVIDSFGCDRLVWGSDWPVVNLRSGLPEWLSIFNQLIAGMSDDEKAAICRHNAERIYKVTL